MSYIWIKLVLLYLHIVIVRRHSKIVAEAIKGKILLDMRSGGPNNEAEKCYGLAQSNALAGFLYRSFRRNWLFDTGGNIVIKKR